MILDREALHPDEQTVHEDVTIALCAGRVGEGFLRDLIRGGFATDAINVIVRAELRRREELAL